MRCFGIELHGFFFGLGIGARELVRTSTQTSTTNVTAATMGSTTLDPGNCHRNDRNCDSCGSGSANTKWTQVSQPIPHRSPQVDYTAEFRKWSGELQVLI